MKVEKQSLYVRCHSTAARAAVEMEGNARIRVRINGVPDTCPEPLIHAITKGLEDALPHVELCVKRRVETLLASLEQQAIAEAQANVRLAHTDCKEDDSDTDA